MQQIDMMRDQFIEKNVGYCTGRSLFIVEHQRIMSHDFYQLIATLQKTFK